VDNSARDRKTISRFRAIVALFDNRAKSRDKAAAVY